jgi:uncharacterized protein YxjI
MQIDRFGHAKYLLVRQLFKLVGSNFRIYGPNGELVLFVHQKGFKLREDIRVFTGEDQQQEILLIKARQIIDFAAAYDVIDSATGGKVGALKRKGWKSIVRDEWIVMDDVDREIGVVREDNVALALVRRFLTNLVPQSYDLMMGEQKICDLRQNFNPFVYKLNIDFTHPGADRRIGIATAILLAAIEGKQR